jgi:hypothetical protein
VDNSFDAFIYRFTCDIEQILRDHLENLKDDLRSDHEPARNAAIKEADHIMDWLYPPPLPLSAERRLQKAVEAANDPSRLVEDRLLEARKAMLSTGRKRGRPRTDTSQHAIQALSIFYAKRHSWRKIALAVKGCKHRRPNPERSCIACGESIRDAAGRLEKFLLSLGFIPPVNPVK